MMNSKLKTNIITQSALCTAFICILAQIIIPIGSVPISLATLGLYIVSASFSMRVAILSSSIYVLMGAIGIPVFAGFSGGIATILGPTGGFIVGYVLLCLIASIPVKSKKYAFLFHLLLMVIGTFILYLLGTFWFIHYCKVDFISAVKVCVIPFVIIDLVKMVLACLIAKKLSSLSM